MDTTPNGPDRQIEYADSMLLLAAGQQLLGQIFVISLGFRVCLEFRFFVDVF